MIFYTLTQTIVCFSATVRTSVQKYPKREGAEAEPWTSPQFSISYSFQGLLVAEWKLSTNNFIRPSNKPPEYNVSLPSCSPGNEATYLAWPQDVVEMKFKSTLCLQRPLQNPLYSQTSGCSPLRHYAVCLGSVVVCLLSLRLVILGLQSASLISF